MTEFVYNNSVHSVTDVISFYAVTDRHLKMSLDLSSHESQTIEISDLAAKLTALQKDLKL